MKIIYHCYGGAHSSVTASSIHLGYLPNDRVPTSEELLSVPYFDRPVDRDHGRIRLMGIDEEGNEVYALGRRNCGKVLEQLFLGLTKFYDVNDMKIVNCMQCVNWMMVLGGFTSRRLRLTFVGRPIVLNGVKHSYWKFIELVQKVKTGSDRKV